MKEKPEICPKCKGRLFLANRDGTKTCASCGATIGTPYADARGSKPAGNKPASTELCPSCGSQADYDSTDASGRPVYSCKFCGNKFSPKPVAAPAPQAPAAPSAPKEEKPEILDGREIFALARSNTVEIHAVFSDAGSAGSGFFICPNYIITNAHVVFDHKDTILGHAAFGAKKVSVCFKGGHQHDAEIVFYNLEEDMALLKTNLPCTSVARISKTMPETGETIYAVGNSAGQGMCILQGIVADQLREVADNEYMMISANIVGGNSGGPIFNAKGHVVGIVTLGSRDAVAMNYGIPVTRIKNFINASGKVRIKE